MFEDMNYDTKVKYILLAAVAICFGTIVYSTVLIKENTTDLNNKLTECADYNHQFQEAYNNMSEQLTNTTDQLRAVATDANNYKDFASEAATELVTTKCNGTENTNLSITQNYTANCESYHLNNVTVINKVIR